MAPVILSKNTASQKNEKFMEEKMCLSACWQKVILYLLMRITSSYTRRNNIQTLIVLCIQWGNKTHPFLAIFFKKCQNYTYTSPCHCDSFTRHFTDAVLSQELIKYYYAGSVLYITLYHLWYVISVVPPYLGRCSCFYVEVPCVQC